MPVHTARGPRNRARYAWRPGATSTSSVSCSEPSPQPSYPVSRVSSYIEQTGHYTRRQSDVTMSYFSASFGDEWRQAYLKHQLRTFEFYLAIVPAFNLLHCLLGRSTLFYWVRPSVRLSVTLWRSWAQTPSNQNTCLSFVKFHLWTQVLCSRSWHAAVCASTPMQGPAQGNASSACKVRFRAIG